MLCVCITKQVCKDTTFFWDRQIILWKTFSQRQLTDQKIYLRYKNCIVWGRLLEWDMERVIDVRYINAWCYGLKMVRDLHISAKSSIFVPELQISWYLAVTWIEGGNIYRQKNKPLFDNKRGRTFSVCVFWTTFTDMVLSRYRPVTDSFMLR